MKIHFSKLPKKNFFWILLFWGLKLSFIFSSLSLIFTTLHCSNKVGKNDKEKKILVVAMEDAPSTLYPPLARSAYSFRAVELIHKGLFKFDENLNPIPDLAEEVKIENLDEEKKRKIALTIKIKDAKTCSGEKISGELVKNSLEEYKRWGKFDYIEKIEAENDKVKLTLSRPYSSVFYDLAVPIFPKNFTDCTGPFKVKKFIPENITELESQDGKLKIIIKGVKNDITRVLELEKGDIDIVVNAIPPHLIDYVKSLKNVHLLVSPGINITYIAFNLKNDILKNKNVRLAIAHAIPKEEIIENILQNQAEPIFSFIPKRSEFYFEDKKIEYNPKLAEKILNESGFKKNENGIRFELTWKTSTVKYAIRNVKAIASYLEKIGIKINIAQREFSTLIYEINKGNFDLFSLNLVGVKDPQILKDIAHTQKTPPYGLNRVFFSNPAFDEIVEKIEEEIDREKRKELVILAQKIIQEELPYLPLWQVKDIIAIRGDKIPQEKISKIKITPAEAFSFYLIFCKIKLILKAKAKQKTKTKETVIYSTTKTKHHPKITKYTLKSFQRAGS
jgi:ABC-type transport system substrate-binding protein